MHIQRTMPPFFRRHVLFPVLVAALFFAGASGLSAFNFTPMVSTIDASEDGPLRKTFDVVNDGNEPVAVEVRAYTREIEEDGSETTEETDEVDVFPSQLVLRPGERDTVDAEWTGAAPDRERAFRVIAEQVPVRFEEQTAPARIRMNLRYVTSLYVRPEGVEPEPVVRESELVFREDDDGSPVPYAQVLLENTGTAHILLRDLRFSPDSGDPDNRGGVLLPGSRRRMYVRLPDDYADEDEGSDVALSVDW